MAIDLRWNARAIFKCLFHDMRIGIWLSQMKRPTAGLMLNQRWWQSSALQTCATVARALPDNDGHPVLVWLYWLADELYAGADTGNGGK